jgi:hypothetical protein
MEVEFNVGESVWLSLSRNARMEFAESNRFDVSTRVLVWDLLDRRR